MRWSHLERGRLETTVIHDGGDDWHPRQLLRYRSSGHSSTRSMHRDEEDNEVDLVDKPTELGVT